MPHLYLVRHAQPDFTGHYDSVTALGLQQSAWLGQHLAARGLRYENFYVACPICMPNRIVLMTGRMPTVNGSRPSTRASAMR